MDTEVFLSLLFWIISSSHSSRLSILQHSLASCNLASMDRTQCLLDILVEMRYRQSMWRSLCKACMGALFWSFPHQHKNLKFEWIFLGYFSHNIETSKYNKWRKVFIQILENFACVNNITFESTNCNFLCKNSTCIGIDSILSIFLLITVEMRANWGTFTSHPFLYQCRFYKKAFQ